jgi:serine/threonine-protein kinase
MTQAPDMAEGLAERETDLPPEPVARPSNVSSNGLIACPACEKPVTESFARFCASCGYRFRQSSLDEERAEFDPLVGRTVADRYRIESVLGRGGMGVVYKVEHTRIGKLMAMKLLHGDLARDREVVQRFRREAESVSKLDHANTVQVFDFGQAEGMTFLVMELLGGKDLGVILQDEGTISFDRVARIVSQVCASLQQAHDKGIVHRDLKPENIRILDDRDVVDFAKVLDFGLAKLRETGEQGNANITQHGILVGTPFYMAPEQIRGESLDLRSDLYALGAVMYKAVCGVPPFWAPTPVGVLTKHLTEDLTPPSQRTPRKDLPPIVDHIIGRAMEKDAKARYASATELKAELDEYLRGIGQGRISEEVARAQSPGGGKGRVRAATQAPEAVATRDEVERFERRIRMQQYAMTGTAVLLVSGVIAAGAYAWTHRTREVVLQTAEVEPNNEPAQANELPAGRPFSAYLGARRDSAHGDEDLYAFVVPSNATTVRLEVSGIPNIDLMVDVFLAGRSDPLLTLDSMPRGGPENAPNLPVTAGRYLVRVRQADRAGHYPIENVSDAYTIAWSTAQAESTDEREWNDTLQQGERVALGDTRTGFIGWGGDVDSYCLETADAMHVALDAVPGLDLQLTTVIDGIDTLSNLAARGEPESLDVGMVSAARRVCVQVSAAQGLQRGDASARYALHLTPAAPEAAPESP